MLLLTRVGVRVLVMRVRQSFVLHGGLDAQLLLPGLLREVEGRVLLLSRVGVGVEVGGGEVEQGVLLREVEVVHGAWNSGLRQYTGRVR